MAAQSLTKSQRDTLRSTLGLELSDLGEVDYRLRVGDFARAQVAGRYYAALMRLLDDLGWEAEVDRDSFELTMPAEQLEFVMRELVNRSDEALDDCAKQMRCEGDPGFWFPPESLQACANDALDTRAVVVGVLGAA